MKTWTIYRAVNVETGQTYVGQTHRGFERRKREHIERSPRGLLKRFHHALQTHGAEKFTWDILERGITLLEDADRLEREWIVRLNAHVSCGGYNLTWGGRGSRGFKHTGESRKKIGDRFRGQPKTVEQRQKMSASISLARRGQKYGPRKFKDPEKTRQRMSEAQKHWQRPRGQRRCKRCGEPGHYQTTCGRNDATFGD